ncbi:MAG: lysophospholipase, partial [Muribaculaceae bacterium]|nr:lysophospholipase [Muribaculaceae bacterium]
IANDLQEQGIASLRFDFNGHGKSEGEFQDMTVLNEIEDLKDVISWAQSQPWVKDISLLGHSQGGVVVSMTAGELGDKVIKNVVLMAPAAVLRDDAIRGNTQGAQYDPWNFKGDYVELPGRGLKLGRKYVETAVNLPIYETAWRYTGPVLVIQGTHDRIVPYTYAERYQQGYKDCTLKLIPEEDHSFTKNTAEAALYAADWLSKQINGH